jgi:MFS family permease
MPSPRPPAPWVVAALATGLGLLCGLLVPLAVLIGDYVYQRTGTHMIGFGAVYIGPGLGPIPWHFPPHWNDGWVLGLALVVACGVACGVLAWALLRRGDTRHP